MDNILWCLLGFLAGFIAFGVMIYRWGGKLNNHFNKETLGTEVEYLTNVCTQLADNNVYIHLLGIDNSEVADLFLTKIGEAWTMASMNFDFKAEEFTVGFGLKNVNFSPDLIEKLRADGFMIFQDE